ncbi:SRPBCC family protein [Nocardiopsis sp. ATB16-24]|uniref:SRPBCC family protein n=1 Tax=Nocardiopsis sp. ATB16-24 TaxID=3019555 RepID=UPI002554AFB1|nr:SRPBCC family protein [Nocardiopsis sp. ATB16-24]
MNTPTLYSTVAPDRTSMRLVRRLPAPPEQVWAAWTRNELLELWFGPALSGEPGPDSRFVLEGRGQHGDTIACEVLVWKPPHQMEITWRYTGEHDSRVRLNLAPAGEDHTDLTLEHHQLTAPADPVDYAAGWHMYSDSLHAHLTGRPPLVDSDARYAELFPEYAKLAGS